MGGSRHAYKAARHLHNMPGLSIRLGGCSGNANVNYLNLSQLESGRENVYNSF